MAVSLHGCFLTGSEVRYGTAKATLHTVLVDGEGHLGGDDVVAADLAELEGAVGVHRLHLQNAVVLLALDHRGLVGLLLEDRRILVDVVHLDVHGGPVGGWGKTHYPSTPVDVRL